MLPRPIRHRRARRTDFDAICALLTASGLPAPTPERAALRRFRRLVADLGADLYVAEIETRVLGLVHITYTRHLARDCQARLELLVVTPEARGRSIGRGLLALAAARARRRGCTALRGAAAAQTEEARTLLGRAGWHQVGAEFEFDVANPAQ